MENSYFNYPFPVNSYPSQASALASYTGWMPYPPAVVSNGIQAPYQNHRHLLHPHTLRRRVDSKAAKFILADESDQQYDRSMVPSLSASTVRSGKTLHFFKHTLRIGGLLNEVAQAIKPYVRWAYNPLNYLSTTYMGITALIAGWHGYGLAKDDPFIPKKERSLIAARNGLNEAGFQFIANLFVPPIGIEAANQLVKLALNGGRFHLGKYLHRVQSEVFLINLFQKQTEFLKRWPGGPGIKIQGLYHSHPMIKKGLNNTIQWVRQHPKVRHVLDSIKQTAYRLDGVKLQHRTALPLLINGLVIIALLPTFDRAFERMLDRYYQPLIGSMFDRINKSPLGQPIQRH